MYYCPGTLVAEPTTFKLMTVGILQNLTHNVESLCNCKGKRVNSEVIKAVNIDAQIRRK